MSDFRAADPEVKYARGEGPHFTTGPRPLGPLEVAAVVHVGVFICAATWAFGGNAELVRLPLTVWGSLSAVITILALVSPAKPTAIKRPWAWLIPIGLFNAVVLVGALNPSFRVSTLEGATVLAHLGQSTGLPTSVVPKEALRALWTFDAIWLSAFNLALTVTRRRALRGLLLVLVLNAFVLAVFGTVQKLAQSKGLYFGAVPSPQRAFFSTFVYHNHWGAFAVLMLGGCIGLGWHYARRGQWRDFLHSPAPAAILAVTLVALTVPLSTSRSCTLVVIVLLAAALGHWLYGLRKQRPAVRRMAVAITVAAAVAAGSAVWFLARDVILQRASDTRGQLAAMAKHGGFGSRAELYSDTWRMAQQKPWFGWGMASYPRVFDTLFNRQRGIEGLPMHFNDAHSDWLQAFAEHGFFGALLLGAAIGLPLLRLRGAELGGSIPRYLLFACLLIGGYAWVEFPFGNFAVVLSWWVCFFTAVHYVALQQHDSSRERTGPTSGTR